ncbi:hypothetical protein ABT234_07955 [Streptomyces sp. NPDC001586]|uniref:hypothetical protein n=1 Tax=Streptomyces sp. NPDC001586 TaxID=3154387 RepID=UPI003320BB22
MHSDGKRTVDEIVAAARQEGLLTATSDHNTSSTGVTWRGNVPTDLLVLNAEEITTRHGHWPAVGLPQGEWVDWRYGPADQGVFDGHVRRVHSLGGLPIAAVGNSDAHTPADAVGRPQNVVRATRLSAPAVPDALRLGRRRPAGASRG